MSFHTKLEMTFNDDEELNLAWDYYFDRVQDGWTVSWYYFPNVKKEKFYEAQVAKFFRK